ncbi:MAG: beta-ketoacyl-[acyl-carrier-protein] synthase family protein [Chryseolinea sp.]
MSQRVFITGVGIITSIGKNTAENLDSLLNRHHGFGTLELLDTVHKASFPCCEIKLDDAQLKIMAGAEGPGFTRTTLLGLIALKEAVRSAGLSETELKTCGLISATTTGGIREFEKNFYDILNPDQHGVFEQFVDTANPGEHCERMADTLGIRRYVSTVSTACSSSANALMQGAALIKSGKMARVICGGTEALSRFTINGFNALMILDSEHCRPFDQTRKGLNLGEGAAYLVLESESSMVSRAKHPLAILSGYGNANDAFHQTSSSPEGTGAFKAMTAALNSAGISAEAVQYINAHGTATENNDLSEGTGLKRVFGENIPPFSSTKPFTGHTLAAAGSIEAVYSLMAIQKSIVWPSLNFHHTIPELNIVPQTELQTVSEIKNVLSNSFGFGGNTSSLLMTAV